MSDNTIIRGKEIPYPFEGNFTQIWGNGYCIRCKKFSTRAIAQGKRLVSIHKQCQDKWNMYDKKRWIENESK